MSVPPEQLSALASLDEAKSVSRLAVENGSPYPTMQKAVNSLAAFGLVQTARQGRERLVSASSPTIAGLARALLFDAPRQDWRAVFHGERLVLLHVLDRIRDPALTAEVLGTSRNSVYHAIRKHAPNGLLLKEKGGYRINPRLIEFRAFLLEWNALRSTKAIRDLDPQATAMWRLGPELMFRSRKTLHALNLGYGAYSAMAAHGAPVIEKTDATTYYYSHRKLTPADAVLQAMVAEGNESAESANLPAKNVRAQWAAFIERHLPKPEDRKDLHRRAPIYNKSDETDAVLAFLANREAPGFLPWKEYERFRQQFGVIA